MDECVPRRLRKYISGHEVVTVPEAGWAGVKNGELLARAAAAFDVFLTVDRNLASQQNPPVPLPALVLEANTNKVDDVIPLTPKFLRLLDNVDLERIVYSISG